VSGPDLSVPDLRSPIDLSVLERASSLFAPLGSTRGWNVGFGRELNATEDRRWFRPANAGGGARPLASAVPVLEGKHVEPFRTLPGQVRWTIEAADAERVLGARYRRARLAYRDVASATNRVTLIAALLPPRSASVHTLFCLKTAVPLRSQQLLCALLNSLVVNFLVRLRVTTHVTTAIVERLPVPREDEAGPAAAELIEAAAILARGHDPRAFARLNVLVARLYQLDASDFDHVLASFPLIDPAERADMASLFRAGAPSTTVDGTRAPR
jgi:hypothetical protein